MFAFGNKMPLKKYFFGLTLKDTSKKDPDSNFQNRIRGSGTEKYWTGSATLLVQTVLKEGYCHIFILQTFKVNNNLLFQQQDYYMMVF